MAEQQQQGGWLGLAQGVLSTGISAWAETQQIRYQANDPTPRTRGAGDYSGPAGSPAFQTLADTLSNPMNLVLLGVAAVLVFTLVAGRR
jgi:hypothetical protein